MKPRYWLLLIVASSLAARSTLVVFFPQFLSLKTSGYDAYAVNLLAGHGFTRFPDRTGDSDLPPLYPFFLAGVYGLLGRGAIQVALAQSILDAGTMGLIFLIGRRVGGTAVGLWSAAFFGMYPYLVYQDLTVNDTSLFIFLLAGVVWIGYRVLDTRQVRFAAALGLALGLAALTKPFVVLTWPVIAIWWSAHGSGRSRWRLALVSGLTALLVIAPWIVRNSLLDGKPVFISTNDGSNLYQGNNPCVADYLSRGWDAQWVDCLASPPPGMGDAAEDVWYRQQAIDYLAHNPGQWPRLFLTKLRVLWSPAITPLSVPPGATASDDPVLLYSSPAFVLARVIHLLYFVPLLALGLAGIVLALRARLAVLPLLAVPAAVTVTYLVFHPSTRYRSPADPFLFIFSALTLVQVAALLRSHPKVSSSP